MYTTILLLATTVKIDSAGTAFVVR